MSDLAFKRTFKSFIFIENLLCIYRNYRFYEKKKQKFVLFHVIIRVCLCVALAIHDVYVVKQYFRVNLSALCMVSISFLQFSCYTMVCIIHGIRQSHSFVELINTLAKIQKDFESDVAYSKCIKKLFCLAVVYFVVLAAGLFYERITYIFFDYLFYNDIVQFVNKVVIIYHYVVEYLVYSLYLSIIYDTFKRFNGLLDEAQKRLDERIGREIFDEIHLEMIEKWTSMYRDIVKSSKAFRKCFGVQIIAAIAVFTFHYISISYRFWVVLLRGYFQSDELATILMNTTFEMFYHTSVLVIAMVSAQKVQNEVWMLKRTLARLYNILTAHPNQPELRKIRSFIRLVEKNPVEINSMPKFGMGLAVLPVILSISVSHIIALLQFDNAI